MCAQENRTAREIGTELGVRYILEGSVRRLGPKVRINVQLIDIEADDHIWAEKFDADTSEIFEVHDQIVSKIVATIGDGIDRKRLQDTRHLAPADLEAYELMLRGLDLHKQGYVSYERAVEIHDLFTQAVEKDPDFPRARAWRVCAASRLWPVHATPEQMQALFGEALGELDRVLKLNSEEPEAHRIYGSLSMMSGDFEKGRFHTEMALSLNPNNSHVLAKSANFFTFYGEPQKAFELLDRARLLNPHFPDWYWQEYGLAHWTAGEYEDAIANLTKSAALTDIDYGFLAASQAALGQTDAARESLRQLEGIMPGITPELFVSRQPFRSETDRARLREQLESVGA
jgi:adenylate cyclase